MTPQQFNAQQTVGNLADAGPWRWAVAVLVVSLAVVMLAVIVWESAKAAAAWWTARRLARVHTDAWTCCDGSYVCVADVHDPGCYGRER